MQSIYIISTIQKADNDKYKFGRHKGPKKKLKSRYRTYLIEPIIYFFKPVNNYILVENIVKDILNDFRIINNNGKKTEWVKLNLLKIIKIIETVIEIFDDMDKKIDINDFLKAITSCKFKCDISSQQTKNIHHFNNHINQKKLKLTYIEPTGYCGVYKYDSKVDDYIKTKNYRYYGLFE